MLLMPRFMAGRVGRRPTIGDAMDGSGRGGNSFDAIRLLAATAVLVSHAFVLTSGSEAAEPLFMLTGGQLSIGFVAVGVFFSISGFLIDRSLERSRSLASFAQKRFLRIAPGLWVSLAATTAFAGAFLAADGWKLFARSTTWAFLGNALLLPAPQTLPGVFEHAPWPQAFNGSLWTLKYEALCYGLTVLIAMLRPFRAPGLIALWLVALVASNLTDVEQATGVRYHLLRLLEMFQFFGFGMILNQYKFRIPQSTAAALALLALWLAMLWTPFARLAAPLLLTYPVIALGAAHSSLAHGLTSRGDMSYGVYVYAFPIQQLFTPLSLAAGAPWAANILLALPVTYLVAVASWLYVEKPMLAFGARRGRGREVSA